jgi:hypothetical protein
MQSTMEVLMREIILAAIVLLAFAFAGCEAADLQMAQQMAPNGTWVGGTPQMAPNGTYVGGTPQMAPDGTYVGVGGR